MNKKFIYFLLEENALGPYMANFIANIYKYKTTKKGYKFDIWGDFAWADTTQGHDYWKNITKKYERL